MSEDKSKPLGPDDVIRICLAHIGDTKQAKIKGAWRQKLRRYLKKGGWPDRVPEVAARQIIAPELASYFIEQLGFDVTAPIAPVGFDVDAAIEATDPLSETNIIAREEWQKESDEDRDYVSHFGEPWIRENQVINMMIRALFFSQHDTFDESAFREDYETRHRLASYMSLDKLKNSSQGREILFQREALDRKLDPALKRGDVSAYLMSKARA